MTLEVKNLCFSYDEEKEILKDVSFTLTEREMTSLLGRNGAGKSTLFKLLLRLRRADRGSILIDGRNIEKYGTREMARIFSYIPQSTYMEFSYTVLDTVLMASSSHLSIFSSPGRREKNEAEEILKMLGIFNLKDRRMDSLSGGERQLVLIARALMQKAGFIILDEPTSNLDYGNQISVLEILEKLNRDGIGIIYSTHNPELALGYSTSTLVLDGGRIESFSSPERLIESHKLEELYKMELHIEKINTGKNERYVCVPR